MNDQQTFMDTATQPTPPGSAPALAPQQTPLGQAVSDYTGKMDTLFQDQQKEFAASQEAQAPYRQKILQMLESPNQAQAHLQKVQEQPKPQDYQKYSMEFASAMAVMGALAGRWTRAGGTAALNAFAGALKGWQQGNLEAYNNASKEWEQASKKTLENNRMEIEKYREIMADKKANIDQMMAAMNLVATEHQNKLMFDATMAKNYTMAFGAVDKMVATNDKATNAIDKLLGIRADNRHQVSDAVNLFNSRPELFTPQQALALKGAADTFGITMNEMGQGTPFKVQGQPRSGPALAMQRFMQEHPNATSDEVTAFAAQFREAQSEAGAIGNRTGTTAFASEEYAGMAPLALQASANVPRGEFVPITRLQQMGQAATSNPAYRRFLNANEAAITAYAGTMSRTGANTVHSQERAAKVLSTADSPEAYAEGIDQLNKEVEAVRAAGPAARNQLMSRLGISGSAGGAQSAPTNNDGWGDVKVH